MRPALEMELGAIAVSERLARFDSDPGRIEIDLAHAPECFGEDFALERNCAS